MWPCRAWTAAIASSEATRSSAVSPIPTRIPVVNGIRSSPAASIVASRTSGCLLGDPLVSHEAGVDRLEHQSLRSRDLTQSGEVPRADRADVRVREKPPVERLLAGPDDVGREVDVPPGVEATGDLSVDLRLLAGQDEELLDPATDRPIQELLDLRRRVEMGLVGRERAVLAVAAARSRERERQVAREGDPAAHLRRILVAGSPAPGPPPDPPGPRPIVRRVPRPRNLLPAVVCAALAAACGSGGRPAGDQQATVVLDFTPNAVHAGIYTAHARHYDRAAGVELKIVEPSSSTDSVKLLLSRRADFAILDIHDLAIARAAGQNVVGILPLVQRPLAAVLAQPDVRSPRELEGRLAGVTGLPSDVAVLDSTVAGAGGSPARVKQVTIGFNAVPALLGGHVAAVTAFWDVEGVALHRARPTTREFRVDEYGAPAYPELVLCVDGREEVRQPRLVSGTVRAIRRGYALTISNPQASAADELAAVPGLDRSLLLAELTALHGAFTGPPGQAFGTFDQTRLRAWATWEKRFGIVKPVPDVGAMFRTDAVGFESCPSFPPPRSPPAA